MSRFLSAVVALVVAGSLSAAEIDIKPVYFQTIPYDVVTDAAGTPWFLNRDGIHNAKGELVCEKPSGYWLLVDRAGRFWFTDREQYGPSVWYYEGGKRVDPKIRANAVWEDTTGRVFAFDGSAVHVLTAGKWAKYTEMVPKQPGVIGEAMFVEDPKGRVWMWLRVGNWLDGLWAFDGKTWTGHTLPGCDPDERVRMVVPFKDDWFLVQVWPEKLESKQLLRFVPFSPSRTADQIVKQLPFDGLPRKDLWYRGEALDGVRYFYHPKSSTYWSVTFDGAVKQIDGDAVSHLKFPQGTSATAVTTIFGKPGDKLGRQPHRLAWPPDGRDAQGRVYVRSANALVRGYEYATHVLWPEKERFGDVLRLTLDLGGNLMVDLFRDAGGTAFGRPRDRTDAVRVWDGERWARAPIAPLFEAKYTGKDRHPPAELEWANFALVGYSTATDARTLFVRVKTRFAVEKGGKFEPPAEEKDPAPLWVYEAWTHQKGAWSGPRTPAELLKLHRKELIEARVCPQRSPGPCPVLGDGTRLWSALDWTLSVTEADGTTATVAIPKPKRKETPPKPKLTPQEELQRALIVGSSGSGLDRWVERRSVPEPLMLATIVPLDDRSVLLVVADTPAKTFRATVAVGKERGVTLEPLETEIPLVFPTVFKPADGPPFAWHEYPTPRLAPLDWIGVHETKWYDVGGHDLFEFRDGKWAKRKDLIKPLTVSADGALWCYPTELSKEARLALCRLRADKVERFEWKYGDEVAGIPKPSAGAAIFGLGDALVSIEPPKNPGEKATMHLLPMFDNIGQTVPIVLPDGTVLFAGAHGKLFDPNAK